MKSYMTFTWNAVNLVKSSEGCRLTAYQDSGGCWTIGYGHAGQDVYEGRIIDQVTADFLLESDMGLAARSVNALVDVPLTSNQFDALVDFVFNLGETKFGNSTMRRKLNLGDYAGAATEFSKWVYVGGKVLRGLVGRRAAEQKLFNTPVTA